MLASMIGVNNTLENPHEVIRINTALIYNSLEWLKTIQVKNVLFTSTSECYSGTIDRFNYKIPTDENVPSVIPDILNKRWSYAGSKSLSEQLVIHSGLKFIVIRPHNIYGKYQKNHFIPEFISRSHKNKIKL